MYGMDPEGSDNWEEVRQMGTSKNDASKAGKLLSNPKTPKAVKSVAASDLAQTRRGKKGE
jgi:hypothetical protein